MDDTVVVQSDSDASSAPGAVSTTEPPFQPGQSLYAGLPLDVLLDAVHRLRIVLATVLGALTIGLLMSLIVSSLGLDRSGRFTREHFAGLSVALGLTLAMVIVTFNRRLTPRRILNIGVAYVLASGFVIAFMYCIGGFRPLELIRGVSWLAVWVVLFPLVVPNTAAKTLFVSLATASMMPLALWVSTQLGHPAPSGGQIIQIVVPNYVAAGVALVPALIINRMHRDVERARRMGSYHLDDLLGRGGMGEVWRASHRMLKRPAAVKLIRVESMGHTQLKGIKDLQKRFEREAQVTASLSSPHTVELYDFGRTGRGTFFYVMELLDGVDLQSLVERFGPLPAERVAYILHQVCDSLADAHHVGLVHRDIKPANIFVCRRGLHVDFVKVVDFGLVKTTRMDGDDGVHADTLQTAANVVAGTPAYMPPEVAQGATLDARADLYSLGCVAYWLLTGQPVFTGANSMQLVLRHVQESAPRPSTRSEIEIPRALEDIVMRCLEKDPQARPASAAALDDMLARTELAPLWTPERAERWWRQHRPERPEQPATPRSSRGTS